MRSLPILTATFLLLVVSATVVAAGGADIPDRDKPASSALAVNHKLKELYEQPSPSLIGDASSLRDQLDRLVKLDADIQRFAPGPGKGLNEESIHVGALRNRALAWLHGWAVFSSLAERTVRQNNTNVRSVLLGDGEKSALGLLLRIYTQIRQAEGNADEPLRKRLASSTNFNFLLGYRADWNGNEPRHGITHGYFIPSVAYLVGHPDDAPQPQRNLFSLWALVNRLLDTWHNLAEDSLTAPADRSGRGKEATSNLIALADWIHALRSNTNLKAFDQKDAAHSSRFVQRTEKIEKFLRFREHVADEGRFTALLDELADNRINGRELPGAVKELVEAARPITDTAEALVDAGVWLRYVLLLSYRKQRAVVADDAAVNGYEKVWQSLQVGIPSRYERPHQRTAGRSPFLRWHRAPDDGHATAVLADLTLTARDFLTFERSLQELETDRFRASAEIHLVKKPGGGVALDPSKTVAYAARLGERLQPLQRVYARHLEPYFLAAQSGLPDALRFRETTRLADPMALTAANGAWASAYRTSTTPAEEVRLARDLVDLASEVRLALQLHRLVRDAYATGDARAIAVSLRESNGLSALSNWDAYALPRQPFAKYRADLEAEIKRLKDSVEAADAEDVLRHDFRKQQLHLREVEERLVAAQLGRQVAQKAVQISETFRKIAELDTEIEDLTVRITRLEKQAWENKQQAAGIRLAYATRMRDLAAAKVDALVQASKDAAALAEEASKELDKLGAAFKNVAGEIKRKKERERAFGIVKAIVSVVGAVLAPFTGGASLTVATLVNKGIDIYKKIDETNWRDFGAAVATISEVGNTLGDAVSLGVKEFGGPEAKKWLAQTQNYLNSAREKFQEFEKLGSQAQAILKGIQELKGGNVAAFASAVANGFPLTSKDGKLTIDLGRAKIQFKDPELQKHLKAIFDAGGHFLNDAVARGRGLTGLAELPDTELTKKLKESLAGAVQALPPEIRAKVAGAPAAAEAKIKAELANLQQHLEQSASPETRRTLAQALAGGLLFVPDANGVVACERPLEAEAKRFQQRLEAYEANVRAGALKQVVDRFEQLQTKLNDHGRQLMKEENEKALEQLAETAVPAAIKEVQVEVENLKKRLAEAEGELEDAKDKEKIAGYEAEAARLDVEAAGLRADQAELRARRARLSLDMARLMVERSWTEDAKSKREEEAARIAVVAAEMQLRRALNACLARGINPLADKGQGRTLGAGAAVRLRGLLTGHLDSTDLNSRRVVDRMAGNVVGMIQWVNLLGLKHDEAGRDERKTPLGWYRRTVQAVTGSKRAGTPGAGMKGSIAEELSQIAEELYDLYKNKAKKAGAVDAAEPPKIKFTQILWLDSVHSAERERLLSMLPEPYRGDVLGVFRYHITPAYELLPSLPTRDAHEPIVPHFPTARLTASYYVELTQLYMIETGSENLAFLVVPPANAVGHPSMALLGGTAVSDQTPLDQPKQIGRDFSARGEKEKLQNKLELDKDLYFTGAIGEWTFYLVDSTGQPEAAMKKIRNRTKEFELQLQMFYLVVKAPLPK